MAAKDAGGVIIKEIKLGDAAGCPLLRDVDGNRTSLGEVLDTMQTSIENGQFASGIDITAVGTTSSIGIDFVDAYTGKVIETGTYQSTASGGVTLNDTNNRPVSMLFDDAGVALAAADHRALLSRVLLTIDEPNTHTLNAMRGQIKMLDGIDISAAAVTAPVQGYLELTGTGARTLTGHVACVRAALEEGASGTTTIAASSYHSGFEATLTSTRTYTETGDMAAFMCNISGGTTKWPNGLFIDDGATVVGIHIGGCTTLIEAAGTITYAMDLDACSGANGTITSDSGSAATTWKARVKVKTDDGTDGWINVYSTSNEA